MRNTMRLSVVLLILSVAHAKEISTDIPEGSVEKSIFQVRKFPAANYVAGKNWTSLSDTLDVFSARNLVKNWVEGKYNVGVQCGRDITTYVEGLKNQELWALKGKF